MNWRNRLAQPGFKASDRFRPLVTPVYRGSTVIFDRQADVFDDWRHAKRGYSYGVFGTPTTLELGARVAQLEGAKYTFIVPGGQAAIALVYLSICKTGSHVLVPASVYGPNREMGQDLLKGFGITVETYDPMIGDGISTLIRPETALVWCESPCSVTMEVQDVPAIARTAHDKGVPVALAYKAASKIAPGCARPQDPKMRLRMRRSSARGTLRGLFGSIYLSGPTRGR